MRAKLIGGRAADAEKAHHLLAGDCIFKLASACILRVVGTAATWRAVALRRRKVRVEATLLWVWLSWLLGLRRLRLRQRLQLRLVLVNQSPESPQSSILLPSRGASVRSLEPAAADDARRRRVSQIDSIASARVPPLETGRVGPSEPW